MADKPGFLSTLGVAPIDERTTAQALADQNAFQADIAMRRHGQNAAKAAVGLLGGVSGAIQGRTLKNFGRDVANITQRVDDRLAAEASGISVEQLKGRREIRKVSQRASGDGSFQSRINLLKQIAKIASDSGDVEVLGNTLRQLDMVRTEQQNFNKLKANTQEAEAEADVAGVEDAFLNGDPVTGVVDIVDGVGGMHMNVNGQQVFQPWGDGLYRFDEAASSRGAAGKSDAELISSVLGKSEFNHVRTTLRGLTDQVRRYESILSLVDDAVKSGFDQEIIGDAGKVASWIDNRVRGIQGILKTFLPGDTLAQDLDLRRRFRGRASDPNDELWDLIELPDWAKAASAQAQNYRAQVMELAYVAARAAEPSNRGLSDNDIINALRRLGAETGNPAVLMRRSFEIVASGINQVDDIMAGYYGSIRRRDDTEIPNEVWDATLGGQAIPRFKKAAGDMLRRFGVDVDPETHRAIIASPLDADVNPVVDNQEAAPPAPTEEEVEAALDILFPNSGTTQ